MMTVLAYTNTHRGQTWPVKQQKSLNASRKHKENPNVTIPNEKRQTDKPKE